MTLGKEIDGENLEEACPFGGNETWEQAKISEDLDENQRDEMKTLLLEYSDTMTDVPGRTDVVKHTVHTVSEMPMRQRPYSIPIAMRDTVQNEIGKMLASGVIEPSKSPWASPIVIVDKKDGTVRFCTDYRRLNKITEFDAYPIPRIDELIDEAGNAKYISTIDLTKGYWQVTLDDEARAKSAFVTPFGLFQYTVMPFGMQNAPATFQRLMNQILTGCEKFARAYIDDICIVSETWEEHVTHVRSVLDRLRQAGLTAKPSK